MSKFFVQTSTTKKHQQGGFTLLEMIVATTIFIFVMLVIISALISLSDASRKARAIRIVMDNLSAATDSMSRNIRMGTYYHCGCEVNYLDYATPKSCATMTTDGGGGESCLAFEGPNGNPAALDDQIVYRLTSGQIERSLDSGQTFVGLTAPEISITDLRFYLYGTTLNIEQPVVTMLLRGSVNMNAKTSTDFDIQTTIAPRTPNFIYTP